MKRLYLYLFILCAIGKVQAQSSNYADRMNHIFGNIDKTKVTTGYLKEFGIRFNSVEAYNGILSDTNWVDVTQWQSLYNSLYSMRVGTVAQSMTYPATVFAYLNGQQDIYTSSARANALDTILLAAQCYTYQQYKTNAYTNGDVTISNESIYDVSGRNPYETKTAFAVAPLRYYLRGNSFSFMLPDNLMYTNTSQTLSAVEIDFGNGEGYQAVSLNTIKNVSYSSGGEKELTVKFVYSGGPTLYSHAKLYVDYVSSEAQARFSGSGTSIEFITGAAYSGATATGEVTIETAGNDGILDKPLIVVEGFDPDGSFDYRDFITNSDPDVVDVGTIDVEIDLSTGLTLNQAIEDEGYDLVFVNFQNGTDYIQRNAYMVEAVIEWVNDNKTGTEKNVVLGMSMGGLVARYALRHMEQTSRTHDTKLYISHDVPHQGSNVPLAYQAFVRHLVGESIGWPLLLSIFTVDIVDITDLVPELNDGLEVLQSPAAQQMLIYQLSGTGTGTSNTTNSLRSSFMSEYTSMGYPVQGGIRNIAISNGSECGTPLGFSANANLVNINVTVDLPFLLSNLVLSIVDGSVANPIRAITSTLSTNTDVKAEFNLKALPNQQEQRIYKGKIYIKKKILFIINVEEQLIGEKTLNATSSMLAVDNAAGGVYDIEQFVSLPDDFDDYILETQFNFIPTYSSLDISSGAQTIVATDLTKAYSMVAPPQSPKNTPFQNFFTNPAISENHIQFTLNNGNWLLAELEGSPVTSSCNQLCTGTDIMSTLTGPSLVCTSGGTFTLNNAPAGAMVTWEAVSTWSPGSSDLLANTSGTGNTAALQATSNSGRGTVKLVYTIQGSCSDNPTTITKENIWIGSPWIDGTYNGGQLLAFTPYPLSEEATINYNQVCSGPYNTVNLSISGSTSGSWQKTYSNPSSIVGSSSGNDLSFYFWAPGQTAVFRFTTGNTCGSTANNYYFEAIDCSGDDDPCNSVAVSPNPAETEINIVAPNVPAPCETAVARSETDTEQNDLTITSITLLDMNGEKVFVQEFTTGIKQTSIDTSGFRKGVYFLKISIDGVIETHRIIINK